MVQLVTLLRSWAWLALAVAALAGCAREPDAEAVRQAVQQQLDDALGGRVLQVERFRRAGAQQLADAGRLVYFDAQLKLMREYDFTRWDAHNVASLANLLGAGPKGIFGLKTGGNQAGDLIGVYGSAAFAASGGGKTWRVVPTAPAAEATLGDLPAAAGASVRPRPKESPLPTAAEAALERLSGLLSAGVDPAIPPARRDAIVVDALDAAYRDAEARLARAAKTVVLAGGPDGGEYAQVVRVIGERARRAGLHLAALTGEGSVGNIRLLHGGEAQFALVQSDIAAAAYAGRGRFGGASQTELRALASLFPEPVQLVVRAGGPIRSLADLKGRRVDIGPESSGTRVNALDVLAANGIAVDSLGAVSGSTLSEATALLAAGKIDALFATVHAPSRALQALAAKIPLAWIDLLPTDALRASGLLPLKLPARTYAGQAEPVQTLAATALLVTRADVPSAQVDALLGLLFGGAGEAIDQGSAVSQIRRRSAREGVTIPWYPGAEAFIDKAAPTK